MLRITQHNPRQNAPLPHRKSGNARGLQRLVPPRSVLGGIFTFRPDCNFCPRPSERLDGAPIEGPSQTPRNPIFL